MSCILRVSARDIESVLESTALHPYRVERGTDAHFDVSKAELEDFSGSINDAIEFLHSNAKELAKLVASGPLEATLDFGVAWRDVAAQFDVLPAELVRCAAEFGFAIELSHFSIAEEDHVSEA